MSWIFEGAAADISLRLSENGHWSVHGTASQDCHPVSHNFEIIRHVRGLPALWSIYSIEDAEHHYDGVGRGLKKFFEINEGRSAALIHYFHATKTDEPAIGLNVVMPPELAAQVIVTFRTIIANPSVRYIICAEFYGITENRTETGPSLGDFLHPDIIQSRGYLSSEVTIAFRAECSAARAT
jgi:hypothetical protein